MGTGKRVALGLLALLFVSAGITHFTSAAFFAEIVPPYLPAPWALVYVSGVAEILLGLLLLAVFPANIHMALYPVPLKNAPAWMGQPTPLQLWLRLPLQFVLAAWAWWFTRPPAHATPV